MLHIPLSLSLSFSFFFITEFSRVFHTDIRSLEYLSVDGGRDAIPCPLPSALGIFTSFGALAPTIPDLFVHICYHIRTYLSEPCTATIVGLICPNIIWLTPLDLFVPSTSRYCNHKGGSYICFCLLRPQPLSSIVCHSARACATIVVVVVVVLSFVIVVVTAGVAVCLCCRLFLL